MVYTYSEARQNLASLPEKAAQHAVREIAVPLK